MDFVENREDGSVIVAFKDKEEFMELGDILKGLSGGYICSDDLPVVKRANLFVKGWIKVKKR